MKLYEIYYHGRSMDSSIPLPAPDPQIRYAVCTNWEREYLVPRDGRWVTVDQKVALS